MPSTPALDISTNYAASSPTAQDKIPAGTLDSDHQNIEAWAAELLAALNLVIRADNTLVDQVVRLRNLHPEVVTALEGLTIIDGAAVAAIANVASLAGLQTIDGHVLLADERVLLTAQTNTLENGLWVAAAGAWARPTDWAAGSTQVENSVVEIFYGTLQNGSTWRLNTEVVVDGSAELWTRLGGSSTVQQIANGGTGATTASGARTNLGSTTVGDALFIIANAAAGLALLGGQPLHARLTALAAASAPDPALMTYEDNVVTPIPLTPSMIAFLATVLSADVTTLLASDDNAEMRTNLQIFGPTKVADVPISTTASISAYNTWHQIGAAADYTITLPIPGAQDVGKTVCIRCDGTFTQDYWQVSIDPNGTDTIFGRTAGQPIVMLKGNVLVLQVTAANKWTIVYSKLDTDWVNAGAITVTGTTSNPTKGGTIARDNTYWRRRGDNIEIRYEYAQSAGGSAGSGTYLFATPNAFVIDSGKMTLPGATQQVVHCGDVSLFSGSSQRTGNVDVYDSTHVSFFIANDSDAGIVDNGYPGSGFATAAFRFGATASVPITNW